MSSRPNSGGEPHRDVAGVAVGVMTLAVFLPYALGALAPTMTVDLGISDSAFGWVVGMVYLVGACLAGASGTITDRWGARNVTVACLAVSAVSLFGVGSARNLATLIAFAALGGFVLAVSNPVTNIVVTTHFPPRRWATVIGWKQSGVPVAAVVSGLVMAPLSATFGWRIAFTVSAMAPLALGLIALSRLGAQLDRATTQEAGDRSSRPPKLFRLRIFSFAMGTGNGIITSYYALYAQVTLEGGTLAGGAIIAILGVFGTAMRIIAIRPLSRFDLEAVLALLGGVAALGAVAVAAAPVVGLWVVFVGAALAGVGALGWLAFAMLAVTQQAALGSLGSASGRVSEAFYAGLFVGPPTAGALLAVSNYSAVWLTQALVYAAAGALMACSWMARRTRG